MAEKIADQTLFSEFDSLSNEAWKNLAIRDLKGGDFNRKLAWPMETNLSVAPFYTQEDLAKLESPSLQQNLASNSLATPLAPREWEAREYLKVDNPGEVNKAALEALNQGATGLLFDLTKVGLVDIPTLLKDIMPAYCGVSFRTGNSAFAIIKKYREFLTEQEADLNSITGQLGFDPISRWMVYGELESTCYHQVFDVLEVVQDIPNFKAFIASGKPVKNAGASISQEIGTILAIMVAYLTQLSKQGIAPGVALRHLSIETAVGNSYFPEIAKFRALRYLIARIAEIYGVSDFNPSKVYLSAQSALWNKTIFDPHVNMLRNTTEAMAAIIGGVNALTILPHDQAFRQSTPFSRRIARNISNLLRDESHLDRVGDPAAGSFFLENLTQDLIEQGWAFFQQIEEEGGVVQAFKNGWLQEQIGEVRAQTEKKILSRRRKLVGVNDYPNAKEKIDPEAIQATEATVKADGEIPLLPPFRAAASFEALRLDTERKVKREGNDVRPKVFLALVGDPVLRKARATFSASFFGVAGFNILPEAIHDTWHEAATQAAASTADIVVLCGSDDNYAEFGEGFAELFLKKGKGKLLVLAGCPQACLDELSKAGFEFFISAQINAVEMLRTFQKRLKIINS